LPSATLVPDGVTDICESETAVTVTVDVPVIPLNVAEIVTGAALELTAVTSPFVPTALLTEAIEASVDAHVTDAVISTFVLSEYIPTAVNCWVLPFERLAVSGVT